MKLLLLVGSMREGSFSKRLAERCTQTLQSGDVSATCVDLHAFATPIYNADDEQANGIPETIRNLKSLIASHDGLAVVSPEYNGFPPPLLVNLFSWCSRKAPNESEMVFAGKPVMILASSPGPLGGVRVMPRLRDMLCELGCIVMPGFFTLPGAGSAFQEDGSFVNPDKQAALDVRCQAFIGFVKR
ncbi:MAG: NAD(P)H-dependent oxidoreductase [Pseudomonadota bacterium]